MVGYQQITIDKQYTILGCNFKNADNTVYAISNFIPYVEGMIKAKTDTGADQIQVRTADGGYKVYFMCNGVVGKKNTYNAELDGQWVDSDNLGSITTDTIANGTGFWFVRPVADATAITVTVAGGVELLGSYTKQLNAQYTLNANPYPVALPVANIPYAEGMVKAKTDTGADQIQVRTADGGYKVYFMCNGVVGKKNTYNAELDGQWVDSDSLGSVATGSIPAGQGFWYIKADPTATFSLTFTSPVAQQ